MNEQNPQENQNITNPLPISSTSIDPYNQPNTSSTNSLLAVILGILSLTCCGFFTAVPAIVLGFTERSAIKKGLVHESNNILALIGIISGFVSIILSFIIPLIYFLGIAMLGGDEFFNELMREFQKGMY